METSSWKRLSQFQKNIKKPKYKNRRGTIQKSDLSKRFTIQPMEDKYFCFGVAIALPESSQTCVVTLTTL